MDVSICVWGRGCVLVGAYILVLGQGNKGSKDHNIYGEKLLERLNYVISQIPMLKSSVPQTSEWGYIWRWGL